MTKVNTKNIYRADQVGSLLRPERIKNARRELEAGEITPEELRQIEDEEIKRVVKKQKEAGLEAVTDGEFRRAWWHFDFLEHLTGVEGYWSGDGIQFQGKATKSRAIKVTGQLGFDEHPFLEDFKFLNEQAGEHTAKVTIPSPSMLHFRGEVDSAVYPDEAIFFEDLAAAYKTAIRKFYDAGCRYLQLDDTAWAYLCSDEQKEQLKKKGLDPDHLVEKYLETINKAVADRPEDLKITMHICRGNFRSTWISSGGYEPVAAEIFGKLNIDGFFLEYDTERAGGFEPLRHVERDDLTIVLGLITSKHGELEDKEEVKKRVEEASKFVPLDQLALSPQCGFASTEEGNLLTEDEQWEKIRHVVQIAGEVWS
ncbi:5-methyltetrahydropteroyltriglutamate--homocysteine S-methyltransferase [Lacicoccus alkaliphilus]|uniref:5-methyltetrahydropteroyltriglutamate--homocysteine methyltransferase n=1 Tax=Lacicoccus alkaliphilus DSM 16010 TaxID=1123231 RepID=A0A1M7AQV5_9BACL|nr:5-methyltetrahydropteroyltriglutamate--homocysteine S-methyltransferase [Salinicoccus alkaliphilus]SHL45077.1 5-methyltetrahydropteroyltriglutamate--homocysteine methyltransferase [Salinicoccus alkaliphilus DSM 16010]